ncbi:MAG: hypothetical protein FJW97_01250 [Actinobacteria bacterium]|nr:hypothetical protein [Actinomycetota bacterium]
MAEWTESQNKKLGWFYVVVVVIALIGAFIVQPFADWGTFGYVLGVVVVIFGLVGLRQALTGKGNTRSRNMTDAKQRQWAIFGLIAVSFALIASIVTTLTSLNATDVLVVGAWVAMSGLFISQIRTLGKS